MIINTNSTKPIYVQIADWLETEILVGHLKQDDKVYSQYQLAEMFNINPATAAKGLNILADAHILYKKRGLGMFVTKEAHKMILSKRKDETLKQMVENLVTEAKRLYVNQNELIDMIQSVYRESRD